MATCFHESERSIVEHDHELKGRGAVYGGFSILLRESSVSQGDLLEVLTGEILGMRVPILTGLCTFGGEIAVRMRIL